MSDLKHKSVNELLQAKADCERYISNLRSKLSGRELVFDTQEQCIEHHK